MTAIEWTHRPGTKGVTWNPVRGCTRKSEGCRYCYAEAIAASPRLSDPGKPYHGVAVETAHGPRWTGAVVCVEEKLREPLSWRDDHPRTCFVNSMSDLFHEKVPDSFIDKTMAAIALKPAHVFIVLTKRDERMRDYLSPKNGPAGRIVEQALRVRELPGPWEWPLPNLWLGVSAEDQATADARIPNLLETPAAVRVVSLEPLLGPVVLREDWIMPGEPSGLDWALLGGETARRGQRARIMHPAWPTILLAQCVLAGVAAFYKQTGSWSPLGPLPWPPQRGEPPQAYTAALEMRRRGMFGHLTAIMDAAGRHFDDVDAAIAAGNDAWLFGHSDDPHAREFNGRRYEQWPQGGGTA